MSEEITTPITTPVFELVDFDLEGLKSKADAISVESIAYEVLQWLVDHVEDYLDNRQTIYRLYFPKDTLETLPEMNRLYELYQSIPVLPQDHPQESLTVTALKYVHAVTAKVKDIMNRNKELRDALYSKLIFYYDTKIRKSGGALVPIIYDIEGYVYINLFDYEAFSQKVEVRMGGATADEPMREAKTIKEIVLPEGYAVEFSLHFWPKTMTTSFGI
jgi:hypothetical protein